jgi:hypothetical protein
MFVTLPRGCKTWQKTQRRANYLGGKAVGKLCEEVKQAVHRAARYEQSKRVCWTIRPTNNDIRREENKLSPENRVNESQKD